MAYVYRHIRLDKNVPFYIGICKSDDKNFKRAYSKTRNAVWKRIAEKTKYEVEILFSNVDIEFAKNKEIELIELYGRLKCGSGSLANIGGGGETIFNPPPYLRQLMSESRKGERNHFYGKKHSEEARKKISEIQKGKKRNPLSEETKIKIGLANKGKDTWTKGKKQTSAGIKRSGVNRHFYKCPILCYDKLGNFVKEFSCSRDIINYFGKGNANSIRVVLVGKRKHWNNHKFIYKEERFRNNYQIINGKIH